MRRKGFTLIELLVVIAIIAILAAILFPVFAKAKERSRASACLNSVKQLSLAFMMYLDDNSEVFPPGFAGRGGNPAVFQQPSSYVRQFNKGWPGNIYYIHDGVNGGYFVNWMDMLYPYIRNVDLMVCPTAQKNTISWGGTNQPISYGYNPTLNGCMTQGNAVVGKPVAALNDPAGFIVIWDCNVCMGVATSGYWAAKFLGNGSNWATPHNNGINVGLADGHAKWYRYDDRFIREGADTWRDNPTGGSEYGGGVGSSPHWYVHPMPAS